MSIPYKLIPKRNPQKPDDAPRYYAIAVHGKTYNLSQLAKLLSARSTTASEGDTFSVLIGLRELMQEILDRCDRVHFDGIGTFEVALSSEGAEDPNKFHQGLIKGAKVKYRSDKEMTDFTNNLKYARYVPQDVKKK